MLFSSVGSSVPIPSLTSIPPISLAVCVISCSDSLFSDLVSFTIEDVTLVSKCAVSLPASPAILVATAVVPAAISAALTPAHTPAVVTRNSPKAAVNGLESNAIPADATTTELAALCAP